MTTGYIAARDLRLALSPVVYMAIFDDDRTKDVGTVDASDQVAQVIDLSASEVASYMPALYTTAPPPEVPAATSRLLQGAQLLFARILSYQRRPEYVKTYGAQPGGTLEKMFREKMMRIQSSIQQIPSTDAAPAADPPNVGAKVISEHDRIIINDASGRPNLGDF